MNLLDSNELSETYHLLKSRTKLQRDLEERGFMVKLYFNSLEEDRKQLKTLKLNSKEYFLLEERINNNSDSLKRVKIELLEAEAAIRKHPIKVKEI